LQHTQQGCYHRCASFILSKAKHIPQGAHDNCFCPFLSVLCPSRTSLLPGVWTLHRNIRARVLVLVPFPIPSEGHARALAAEQLLTTTGPPRGPPSTCPGVCVPVGLCSCVAPGSFIIHPVLPQRPHLFHCTFTVLSHPSTHNIMGTSPTSAKRSSLEGTCLGGSESRCSYFCGAMGQGSDTLRHAADPI